MLLAGAAVALPGCGGEDEPPEPVVQEQGSSQAEEDAASGAARAYLQNSDPKRCAKLATQSGLDYCRSFAGANTLREPDPRIEDVAVNLPDATVRFVATGRGAGSILMRKVTGPWRGEAVTGADYQPKD